MRNAKLAAVLLLALTGGASAVLTEAECGIFSEMLAYEGECDSPAEADVCASMDTLTTTSANYAAVLTAGTAVCAASSDCNVQSNTTFAAPHGPDDTIVLGTLNTCKEFNANCIMDPTHGFLDDCVQNGYMNIDGTKSAAVATVSASAFVLACVSAAVAAFA